MEKWKFIIRLGIFTAHLRLGTWFMVYAIYSYYLQFHKTM